MSESIDDLLGPAPTPPVAPVKPTRKPRTKKVNDLVGKRKYQSLPVPKVPEAGGLFALKESKGRNLGRTCLICKTELKQKRGRPAIICGKVDCFRKYRNAYRHDYDKVRG